MICYRARWVLPVSHRPIEDGVVAVSDGIIQFVGPRQAAPAGDIIDLGDAILMPGLVNVHTHLELTSMRGFLEELDFPEWIDTLRQARNTVFNGESLLDAARLGILEGLEHGITTYADTCSSGAAMQAMHELGVRGIMYQETFGPHPDTCDAAMRDLQRRVDEYRPQQTALVTLGVSPHAPYTVSDNLYRATADYAHQEGLPMAMHIAESADEWEYVVHGQGPFADRHRERGIPVSARARTPIALLDELNCLQDRPLLIHSIRVDEEDIRTIVRSSSAVAHCPASNAKLGHGIAPLESFLTAGLNVGVGSDSVASNNRMDMLEEARLASLFQAVRSSSAKVVSAERSLELATIRGARALGLDGMIGSLDVGKAADLAAFPLSLSCAVPASNPVATAVYALGGVSPVLVTVAGRHLIEDGRHTVMAPAECQALQNRVTTVGQTLAARAMSF